MTEQEKEDRHEALNNAVRHKTRNESPEEVVEAAKKYFEFLQDK